MHKDDSPDQVEKTAYACVICMIIWMVGVISIQWWESIIQNPHYYFEKLLTEVIYPFIIGLLVTAMCVIIYKVIKTIQ